MTTNNFSPYVEKTCARAERMLIGDYLIRNPMPLACEIKYDGVRVFLFKSDSAIILATKINGIYTEKQYPELFSELNRVLGSFGQLILDCEFLKQKQELVIFDVINVEGQSQENLSYGNRRKVLTGRFARHLTGKRVYLAENMIINSTVQMQDAFDDAVKRGFEGIVVKTLAGKYGEAGAWMKLKQHDTIDVVVTGRDNTEGPSFFIGVYDGEKLVDMGKVGSFQTGVDTDKITVGTVLEVQYQEITDNKRLRHPFAVRIRDDKKTEACKITQLVKA